MRCMYNLLLADVKIFDFWAMRCYNIMQYWIFWEKIMLKIAFDSIDVTPECNGLIGFTAPEQPLAARDSLFARLFLLQDDEKSSLIISLDYGGLYCSAHDQWRKEVGSLPDTSVLGASVSGVLSEGVLGRVPGRVPGTEGRLSEGVLTVPFVSEGSPSGFFFARFAAETTPAITAIETSSTTAVI